MAPVVKYLDIICSYLGSKKRTAPNPGRPFPRAAMSMKVERLEVQMQF